MNCPFFQPRKPYVRAANIIEIMLSIPIGLLTSYCIIYRTPTNVGTYRWLILYYAIASLSCAHMIAGFTFIYNFSPVTACLSGRSKIAHWKNLPNFSNVSGGREETKKRPMRREMARELKERCLRRDTRDRPTARMEGFLTTVVKV